MTGEERRSEILNTISSSKRPVSGAALAEKYQVSRQVIVQDIALLRAANHEISSTNRGYLIVQPTKAIRVLQVSHTDMQMEDELNTIVDMGGVVRDVFIEHAVYGHLQAKLDITSRRKVQEFMGQIARGQAKPLTNLTSGLHSHTIEAQSEEDLDIIEEELRKKGYLQNTQEEKNEV